MDSINFIFNFVGFHAEAVVALAALGLALYQGISTNRHNRLSMRPKLGLHRSVQNKCPQISLDLTNDGIGPAYVEYVCVFFDELEQKYDRTIWTRLIKNLNLEIKWGGGSYILVGECFRPGQSLNVFTFVTAKDKDDCKFDAEMVNKEIDRIQVVVKYKSAYGESFFEKAVNGV